METILNGFDQKTLVKFLFFFLGILIFPVVTYFATGYVTSSQTTRAFASVGVILLLKVGYVVWVMRDPENFAKKDKKHE